MLKQFINNTYFYLYTFTLTFAFLLYSFIGFQFIDEICSVLLFILLVFYIFKTPDWRINKAFLFTIVVFIFYIFYSIIIESNTKKAIFMDSFVEIKPYLSFFCVYSLAPIFSENQKAILRIYVIFWGGILFIIGLSNLVFPDTIDLFLGHPAYYGASTIALAFTYLICSNYKSKDKIIFILLLSIGLFSTRAKFYGFYVISIFIIAYFTRPERLVLNFKTAFISLISLVIVAIVAWDKIELYFINGIVASEENTDMVARFVLYDTSIDLFKDYFPFGTGFASFATWYSGEYYSNIYVKYGIEGIYGITKDYHAFVADTYYPQLAQYGVVGIFLYLGFWLYIAKRGYNSFKLSPNKQMFPFLTVLMLIIYFAIEGTSDSTFTSHRGFFILMILGLTLAQMKQSSYAEPNILNENENTTNK